MPSDAQKTVYEFSPFRLDAGERLLLRDGEVINLTPKSFDLLRVLVERPGRLLSKEQLLQAVWPDAFVEENNLADNISKLRKALSDGENGHRFIETVPKVGYRFVASVKNVLDERPSGNGILNLDEKPELPNEKRRTLAESLAAHIGRVIAALLGVAAISSTELPSLTTGCTQPSRRFARSHNLLTEVAYRASRHGLPTVAGSPTAQIGVATSISGCSRCQGAIPSR
jgi:DNA-binding winged helix-turn-helix (wHTH) protein